MFVFSIINTKDNGGLKNMQVNAISSVNFEGRKNKASKSAKRDNNQQVQNNSSQGYLKKLSGPVAAALFLIPVATTPTACTDKLNVSAHAGVTVPFNPSPADTVVIRDTIYIPPEFEFPSQIEDSLNIWRGDILDVPVDGDDGSLKNKALLYLSGARNWDYNKPEYIKLNLEKSDIDEARYDHVITDNTGKGDDIKNDIRITLVDKGTIKVVERDGSVTDEVSGLMFNEDGVKTFMHSNGRDSIFVYPKATSGEHNGKYVRLGSIGRGYLPEEGYTPDAPYGKNVLLHSILSPGTEDHYIQVKGKVMDVDKLKAMAEDVEYTVED